MIYRPGRHNPQIIYRQLGDEPSTGDPMVATVMDPADATLIVDSVNAGLAGERVECHASPSVYANHPRFRVLGGVNGRVYRYDPHPEGHPGHDRPWLLVDRPLGVDVATIPNRMAEADMHPDQGWREAWLVAGPGIGEPPDDKPVHTIAWTIEPGGAVRAEVTCAAPAGSNCRMTCPHQAVGCESWPCGHDLVDGPCNAVEWINDGGVGETYSGPATSARDGAIEVEWSNCDYTWRYA